MSLAAQKKHILSLSDTLKMFHNSVSHSYNSKKKKKKKLFFLTVTMA